MKTKLLFLSLLFHFACKQTENPPPPPEQGPPNILFLIADDWSYPHAGAYGDKVIQTPTFDRLAREGALFHNAYCAAPSCAPSRAAILTGRHPHQLESAGNLWSVIPAKFPNWVSLLKAAGYHTGKTRKGWAPGDHKQGGYSNNPAGKDYSSFEEFFAQKPQGKAFSFWFGSSDPHRRYERNSGSKLGMKHEDIIVPGFLPNLDCVRNDIMDYYFEVERFDRECGQILSILEEAGELDNTLVVMTSDNGMPFPRAKANLYDYGTRMPLVMYWEDKIPAGKVVQEFMNFVDFGPSFLEAAGIDVPAAMSGQSLLPLLVNNDNSQDRQQAYLERERHANVRKGDLSYPCRAIRTTDYLYIRNFEPERWPAGDPQTHISVGQYGDVDNSISKYLILAMEGQRHHPNYFKLTFEKRPAEELYQVKDDPFQLNNLAEQAEHQEIKNELQAKLESWMKKTNDLRVTEPQTIYWDTVEYTPDYQFYDFDLKQRIAEYKMLKAESGRYKEYSCE